MCVRKGNNVHGIGWDGEDQKLAPSPYFTSLLTILQLNSEMEDCAVLNFC